MPDFPYINARVRAMRSRLLDAGRMEEILGAPSFEAFLQALTTTPYGSDLSEALARYRGIEAVDEALGRNFFNTTRKILGFSDGKARTLLEALLLRWDLANVRAVIRGKHTGRSEEEITPSILPAGTLSEPTLREMTRQPDLPAVAGVLAAVGHPLAPALTEALRPYVDDHDLLGLELRLDREYADLVLRMAAGNGHNEMILRELVQAEIDALNVKTAVKLARAQAEERFLTTVRMDAATRRAFFIAGGTIVDEDLFVMLSDRTSLEEAWRILRIRGFPAQPLPEDLTAFEKDLDALLTRASARLYLTDPLGIEIVVGYLALKYNEVVNLRLIARSKFLGIPRDMVRREMVVV